MIEPVSPDGLTGPQVANLQQVQQRDVIASAGSAMRLASGTGNAADQATVMDGSAANLVSAAGTGFKIQPEAAKALAESCGESLRILGTVRNDILTVAEKPALGTLPGVSDIATFTGKVGGDDQGIGKAVESLMSTLTQMQQAYENAARSYQNIDDEVKAAVSKFKLPSNPQA
jgi:hypothetical protein